jgi:hypothetical protein
MLPGFRFLLAATFLSGSMLVFGLGAAAMLRAAHEEFASNPSWRAAPEPRFTESERAARPNLAMLRLEPRLEKGPGQKTADGTANMLSADAPPELADLAGSAAPGPQPEKIAATRVHDAWPPFRVDKMKAAVAEDQQPTDAIEQLLAKQTESSMNEPEALSENATAPAAQGTADTETTGPEPAKPEAANAEQMRQPSTPEPAGPTTTVAALGEQSAVVEEPAKLSPKPDENAAKARLRAQRARARRLARARLARQQAAQAQFLFFPFFVQQQQPLPQQQRRVIQARNP